MMLIRHAEQVAFIVKMHFPSGSTSRKRFTGPRSVCSAALPAISALVCCALACIQATTSSCGIDCFAASMAKPVVNISGRTITSRPVMSSS
jgi:hypothetical protein